jgi:hypothetical protein
MLQQHAYFQWCCQLDSALSQGKWCLGFPKGWVLARCRDNEGRHDFWDQPWHSLRGLLSEDSELPLQRLSWVIPATFHLRQHFWLEDIGSIQDPEPWHTMTATGHPIGGKQSRMHRTDHSYVLTIINNQRRLVSFIATRTVISTNFMYIKFIVFPNKQLSLETNGLGVEYWSWKPLWLKHCSLPERRNASYPFPVHLSWVCEWNSSQRILTRSLSTDVNCIPWSPTHAIIEMCNMDFAHEYHA